MAGSVAMAALPRTAGLLMGLRWVQRIETTAALVAGARVISPSKRATENSANEEPRVRLERHPLAAADLGSIPFPSSMRRSAQSNAPWNAFPPVASPPTSRHSPPQEATAVPVKTRVAQTQRRGSADPANPPRAPTARSAHGCLEAPRGIRYGGVSWRAVR